MVGVLVVCVQYCTGELIVVLRRGVVNMVNVESQRVEVKLLNRHRDV